MDNLWSTVVIKILKDENIQKICGVKSLEWYIGENLGWYGHERYMTYNRLIKVIIEVWFNVQGEKVDCKKKWIL